MQRAHTGWFYRIHERVLDSIPANPAGRRVFDETLADWRRESQSAVGHWSRLCAAARGFVAVVRSLGRVAWEEAGQVSGSGIPQRLGRWMLALTILGLALSVGRLETSGRGFDAYLYSTFVTVVFYGPALLLLSSVFGRSMQGVPTLGVGLLATSAAVLVLGIALPATNHARQAVYPPTRIPVAEWTQRQERHAARVAALGLTQVVAVQTAVREALPRVPAAYFYPTPVIVHDDGTIGGYGFPSTWSAVQWVNRCLAYLALCCLVPLLADRLRQRDRRLRVIMATLVSWLLLYELVWVPIVMTEWLFLWFFFGFGVPWLSVCVVALVCTLLRKTGPARSPAGPVDALEGGLA